jgi:peptidoglycan/xylan/chitin deacetylase (PgdA/CDA1 family)
MSRTPHGMILCFHGLENAVSKDVASAHVSVAHFRDTVDMARDVAEAVSLRELIDRQTKGRSTAGLFALTFDDAYLSLTRPDVRDLLGGNVPITLFVVTDASGAGQPFWWDRVETLQPMVSSVEWESFENSIGLPDRYRTGAAAAFGPLRPIRQWVLSEHAGRWPRSAEGALQQLELKVRMPKLQRPMRFDEIEEFVRRGSVDIGVHTASHAALPRLSDAGVVSELADSYALLRERWPSSLPWVAVPFGLYDQRTANLAHEAGLTGMLSLNPYTMEHASPVHGLPRLNISESAGVWKLGVRLSGLSRFVSRPASTGIQYPAQAGPD